MGSMGYKFNKKPCTVILYHLFISYQVVGTYDMNKYLYDMMHLYNYIPSRNYIRVPTLQVNSTR